MCQAVHWNDDHEDNQDSDPPLLVHGLYSKHPLLVLQDLYNIVDLDLAICIT